VEDILLFIQEEIWLIAALAIFVGLFARRESSSAGNKLSINQVVQALNAENAVLVDVRDNKEFEKGHVVNAINIPHSKITENVSILDKHKDKQIILTDAVGQHTGNVGRQLKKAGFTIARMNGGMGEWRQQGLPVIS
jgi:rhodanese-related sulfurtransferase